MMCTVPVMELVLIVRFLVVPEPLSTNPVRSMGTPPPAGIAKTPADVPVPTFEALQAVAADAALVLISGTVARVVLEAAVPLRAMVTVQATEQSTHARANLTVRAAEAGCWIVIASTAPESAVVLMAT